MTPYQHIFGNKISRHLVYHIITINIPKRRSVHMLRPVKDGLDLKVPDTYPIPCKHGADGKCKEH
jgi:hypothetical protein